MEQFSAFGSMVTSGPDMRRSPQLDRVRARFAHSSRHGSAAETMLARIAGGHRAVHQQSSSAGPVHRSPATPAAPTSESGVAWALALPAMRETPWCDEFSRRKAATSTGCRTRDRARHSAGTTVPGAK